MVDEILKEMSPQFVKLFECGTSVVVVAAHSIASFSLQSDERCLAKVAAECEFQKKPLRDNLASRSASTSGKRIAEYSDPKTFVSTIACSYPRSA